MNFVVNMFDRVIKYSCPQNSFVFTVAYDQSLGISSFVFVIVCACFCHVEPKAAIFVYQTTPVITFPWQPSGR